MTRIPLQQSKHRLKLLAGQVSQTFAIQIFATYLNVCHLLVCLVHYQQDLSSFTGFSTRTSYLTHLNTIGGCWYFGRVLVPLRPKNQSLYHRILLLQKFYDIGGKVFKHFFSASAIMEAVRGYHLSPLLRLQV